MIFRIQEAQCDAIGLKAYKSIGEVSKASTRNPEPCVRFRCTVKQQEAWETLRSTVGALITLEVLLGNVRKAATVGTGHKEAMIVQGCKIVVIETRIMDYFFDRQ